MPLRRLLADLLGFRAVSLENPSTSLAAPAKWLLELASGGQSAAGIGVTEEKALGLPVAYACARLVANTLATLPLHVFRRAGRFSEPDPEHWAQPLLAEAPNLLHTAFVWRELMALHALLWGNHYSAIDMAPDGGVEFVPLLPWNVRVQLTSTGRRKVYAARLSDGTEKTFREDEVIHVPALSSDGLTGISPVRKLRNLYGSAMATETFGSKFFANDARPSVIMETPGKLSEEAQQRLIHSLYEKFSGAENKWKVLVLEEGAKMHMVQMPLDDAQFLGLRDLDNSLICSAFGTPPHMVGLTSKVTCVPGDALVATPDGPRRADTMQAGMRVWSLAPDGRFVARHVLHAGKTGDDKILTIRTRARELRVNGRHRVLARRKFNLPASRSVEWRNVWLEARELCLGDYLVMPRRLPPGAARIAPNGREISAGFMEFCGLYLGDGCMDRQKNGVPASISIARHAKAPYMDHYRRVMQEEFVARGKAWSTTNQNIVPISLQEYERFTRFSSRRAAEELLQLGFGGTAHTKRVPAWVFGLADDLKLAFLRGYLDSDGAVHERGWIVYSSCSGELLADIQQLCWSAGVPTGRVNKYKLAGAFVINGRTCMRSDMHQLYCYHAESNRLIGSRHPRKEARLKAIPRSTRIGPWDAGYLGRGPRGTRPGETFSWQECALQPIKSIEESAIAQPVYDLVVEDTHIFVSDGVVVHNSWGSGISELSLGFSKFTILPWVTKIELELKRKLFTDGVHFAKHSLAGLERGDMKSRQDAYQLAVTNGLMTIDEVRELEDLPPHPEGIGARPLVPVNMQRLDQLGASAPTSADDGTDKKELNADK